MNFRLSGTTSHTSFNGRFNPITRARSFVQNLSAGDKTILAILSLICFITSFVSLIAFERSFMVAVPAHGGSLTEGVVGSPRFINPLLAITDADRDLSTITYAGLMGIGPDGLRPVLASSYTISEDGKTYTFILRNGVKFSDGTPVTADDIVFTVEKAMDPKLKSPELANWSNVRVESVDARTVRFTLPKAYAPFLANTTLGILPAHVWSKIPVEQFPFSTYMTEPIGAGPFQVSAVTKNAEGAITRYDVKANETYALGAPYLSSMRFVFFETSSDLLAAEQSGRVESAYGIPVAGGLRAPYSRIFGVFLNPAENKALADLSVRKALSLAIDRDHLTTTILGGFAEPRTDPLPTGVSEAQEPMQSSDRIQQAKDVLTKAGWTYSESNGTWSNAKTKLTLNPITLKTSNVPELKTLAGEIEKNWEAIGVKTSLEFYDQAALSTDVIRPRKYDALFFGLVVGRENDLFAFWDSSERNDPGLNIALYANKTVDTLLEKARTQSDEAERTDTLTKASNIISAEYGAIFTHTPYFLYVVPKDLKGVILPEITTPSDRFATVSSWHRRTQYVWPVFVKK